MDTHHYMLAKAALLTIVEQVAPEHLTSFRLTFAKAEDAWYSHDAGAKRRAVLTHMVGCLQDGLRYGNWPGVV